MPHITFHDCELAKFCCLDELGFEAAGQRIEPRQGRCWPAGWWSRRPGATAVVRRAHHRAPWSAGCAHLWCQETTKTAEPRQSSSAVYCGGPWKRWRSASNRGPGRRGPGMRPASPTMRCWPRASACWSTPPVRRGERDRGGQAQGRASPAHPPEDKYVREPHRGHRPDPATARGPSGAAVGHGRGPIQEVLQDPAD